MKYLLNEIVEVDYMKSQLELQRHYLTEVYVLPNGDPYRYHPCKYKWNVISIQREPDIPHMLWVWVKCTFCDIQFKLEYHYIDSR